MWAIPNLTAKDHCRFWAKVDVRGPDECWEWTAYKRPTGYGMFQIGGRFFRAHRVALAISGRDALELCALHRCDNPPCCNPAHLLAGTHAENMADMAAKGRRRTGISTKPAVIRIGERNPRAKLKEADVLCIRSDPRPQRVVAHAYGISQGVVNKIKGRKIWRHLA